MKPSALQEVQVSTRAAPAIANDRLLTVKEVALLLGMSQRWVHERTRRGEIPCYRFGTALRFDLNETRVWMAKWHQAPGEF